MADIFGGILDDMRDIGDSVPDFFSTALSRALASGGKDKNAGAAKRLGDAYELSKVNNVGYSDRYSPTREISGGQARAVDAGSVEADWIQRIHKFGGVDNALQQGKVSTGKPQ